MKNKEVVHIRVHVGIHQFAGQQTLEKKKMQECTMEMNTLGVLVSARVGTDRRHVLIPFSNILHIELVDGEDKK